MKSGCLATATKHTLTTMKFYDMDNFRMEGFNHRNAIFGLGIEQKTRAEGPTPYLAVDFEASVGIDLKFTCLRIEIVDALSCDAECRPIPCANLRGASRCVRIGSEVIVETPCTNRFPQGEHFRRVPRIGNLHHHRIEWRERLGDDIPAIVLRSESNNRPATLRYDCRRTGKRSMPDALLLDHGSS
jgi:hypothetical protein